CPFFVSGRLSWHRSLPIWFSVSYSNQRLLDSLLILHAHRKIVTPRAPFPGSFVEAPVGDLAADVLGLCEELREILARPRGYVPFDLWLFRLHQHAQRRLLHFGLGELVRGELVGEDRLVLLVGGIGRLEIDDRTLSVNIGNQVDDADEGQVQARDPQLETFLRRRDVSDPGQL